MVIQRYGPLYLMFNILDTNVIRLRKFQSNLYSFTYSYNGRIAKYITNSY
jgi:hypothetical protein